MSITSHSRSALVLLFLSVALTTARPISAQTVEPIGRILRDPSRTREPRIARAGPRVVRWFLTPSGTFTANTKGAVQVKASTDFQSATVTGYVAAADVYTRPDHNSQGRIGGEIDPTFLGDNFGLSIGGELAKTQHVSTDGELWAELDWNAVANVLTFGGIAYEDWTKPSGADDSINGATFGLTGVWTAQTGTSVLAEYDFNSDFNGEDGFAAKAVQNLGKYAKHDTQLIVGAGKHRVVTIALKITLR